MKRIAVVLAVIPMIILCGCMGDTGQKIEKRYRNLESYMAEITVEVTGNKGKETYEMIQVYQSPDRYRIEVISPKELAGTVTIVTDEETRLLGGGAPEISFPLNRTDAVDSLSVSDFFRSYFDGGQMEETEESVNLSVQQDWGQQVLELDKKTLVPKTMWVYGKDGKLRIQAEWNEFELDAKIDKEIYDGYKESVGGN